MDSGDGAILDFDLGELGLMASNPASADTSQPLTPQVDQDLQEALRGFDQLHGGKTASVCVIRVGVAATASETVRGIVKTRAWQRLERSIRDNDVCARCTNGDVTLALADCDVEAARKSITLLMKLFSVELLQGPDDGLKVSAGIAPYAGSAVAAQRTAQLACDLAAFQDNGYIEVVEF